MNQIKTAEQIRQQYVKTNKENRPKLLKKYGIKKIDDITRVVGMTGTVECNMTELSRVLLRYPDTPIKVSFQKILKEKEIYEKLNDFYFTVLSKDFEKPAKKFAKEVYNGVETTRNGFHNGKLDSFGRLYFVDTDQILDKSKSYDNRMILISLNHLNFVEVNGVKYILK